MRIFQPTFTNRKGKKQRTEKYHVSFKDHTGVGRRVTAFSDKAASESLGRKLERLAALRALRDPMPADLADWIDGIDDDLREKLTDWGMVDMRARLAAQPLAVHIADWITDVRNRGKSENHAALLEARVNKIIVGCGFNRYADITVERVNAYLAERKRADASTQTLNHHIGAIKQFTRWMFENDRAGELRLAGLKKSNVEADRRYVRRALTVEELSRLIATTQASKIDRNCAGGAERAIVYRVATATGLRANEIRTLTAGAFDLDSDKPTLTVKASNTKNRRAVRFALAADLAAALRLHLATKLPTAPAFGIGRYTATMIQSDCEDAKIAIGEADARIDFHSLRATFITNLARAGVSLQLAQQLARHSDPRLTANVYSNFSDDEKRQALELLPTFASAG